MKKQSFIKNPKTNFFVVSRTLSLLILFFLIGCTPSTQKTDDGGKQKVIAMNVIVSQVPFWNESKQKLQLLEKELNIKTVFGGPTDINAQNQINEIENLISQKVDGIIVTPTDSKALVPIINKAVDAGIPVITMLGDVPGSKRLMYVTSELEEASKAVAQYVFTNNKKEGKAIILMGAFGSEEQERRADGFKQAVSNFPNLKIVDIIEDGFDASIGAQKLKSALIREGKVDYIFGCNSRSAAAAKLAVDELKYNSNQTIITGWDTDDDVLQDIKNGDVYVSAAQQMTFMTQLSVMTLNSYIDGSIYPKDLDLKSHHVSPVPDKLVIPINLITKNTAAAYLKTK